MHALFFRTCHSMTLSVVLPCYNEESNIEHTVRDVAGWMDRCRIEGEVIVVDDGSRDGSLALLERMRAGLPRLRVVRHDANKGYGAAVRTGCDASAADAIAFMDSDGQFHAEDIGRLLPSLDKVPLVAGVRVRRADPLNRKLNAWLYGMLVRIVLRVKVRDLNCGLKVYRRSLWQRIRPVFASGALFNAELFLNLRQTGEAFAEVPVPHYPRRAGMQTGANPAVVLRMFRELFALRKATVKRFAEKSL